MTARYFSLIDSVTGFLRSLTCFSVRKYEARTGCSVRFTTNAPNRAATTAKAVGRNMAPSIPCKVSRGRNTKMMMRLAENR